MAEQTGRNGATNTATALTKTNMERSMATVAFKACSCCGLEKPADQFSPDRRARTGLQAACRQCQTIAVRGRRAANPEAARAREIAYFEANKARIYAARQARRARDPERFRKAKREYYQRVKDTPEYIAYRDAQAMARKDKKREYDKAYRASKDPEIQLERARAWRAANPEKRAAAIRNYRDRRRAQEEGGVSTAELASWTIAQPKICYWCDAKCPEGFHVDHYVPLSKGGPHELHNLVIACAPCNLKKNAKDPIEFAHEKGRLF